MDKADLPKSDNPSQNSQIANAIRNQSTVKPEDYPKEKRRPEEARADRKRT